MKEVDEEVLSDEEEIDELAEDMYESPKTDKIDELTFLRETLESFQKENLPIV